MPKKYLLYIHNSDRFDTLNERGQKSNLVNDLLDKHWLNIEQVAKLPKSKKPLKEVDPILIDPKPKVIKTPAEASKAANVETCPHGYAKGNCKKADCNKKFAALQSA
jgi:hypothetical protein